MVSKRHLKNLEIILANGAILQWATWRCFMCGGCGHGYWECSNKYAIPYEEWTRDKGQIGCFNEAINDQVQPEEPTHDEEEKSSDDVNVVEKIVFNSHVEDKDEVITDEPILEALELPNHVIISNADDYDISFVFDHFVETGTKEEKPRFVKYSKDDSSEYYILIMEKHPYVVNGICLKQVPFKETISSQKLYKKVPTDSGKNPIVSGSLNFPFDMGILI
ncbi:unnamed protein product [Cuscuta campestris]|uniref:Uncharacterized protein n=1 Tax=Cuscuta campestris TaxID=132261 RepID=A0A484LSC7_9ASTE|nr:unnamed protein product [Cuscuta campestris]